MTDGEIRRVATALRAVKRGNFAVRLEVRGERANVALAKAFNELVEQCAGLEIELARLEGAVVREGRAGARASLRRASGGWKACVACVNSIVDAYVQPT